MLRYPEPGVPTSTAHDTNPLEAIDLERVLSAIRRQLWIVGVFGIFGAAAGIAFVTTAVPLYTSSADILIDKRQPRALADLSTPEELVKSDDEMGSQVELLLSDHMAREVVNRLNLTENAAFNADQSSFVDAIKRTVRDGIKYAINLVAPEGVAEDDLVAATEDRVRVAAGRLRLDVDATRLEGSYVIRVTYTSSDPVLSAAIANAYGNAYLDDQLQAKYDAARRASGWLQSRIAELKDQSLEADLAVQRYRNANGLLSTGTQLLTEQQLGDINAQLVSAEASKAEAKARLDQINTIIQSGQTDAVVDDALGNALIINLRSRYLDASRREAEITRKLGSDHAQSVRLRAEMEEYKRLIFSELRRIGDSYESTYNVALRREEALRESLRRITSVNQDANTSGVQLRELEREAETYRTLYNNFLQRYQEAIQQQSFPVSDSRLITQAQVSRNPSYPKIPLMLGLWTILGVGFGSGVGAFREYRDRFFRMGSQVRQELNLEHLGSLKKVPASARKNEPATKPSPVWRVGSMHTFAEQHPFSAFSETLRNVKIAADTALSDKRSKVIGVVSSLPGEGKTSTSANLASILTLQGAKVLLIDADLRNPGLSRNLAISPPDGIVEVLLGTKPLAQCLLTHNSLSILPAGVRKRIPNSSDLLASAGMDRLLATARNSFDYIIVDLPPVGAVVDAKAFAHRADGILFVVEWGCTSRALVRNTLSSSPALRERCIGVVFNKEDEEQSKFYRSHASSDYYSTRYADYYQ